MSGCLILPMKFPTLREESSCAAEMILAKVVCSSRSLSISGAVHPITLSFTGGYVVAPNLTPKRFKTYAILDPVSYRPADEGVFETNEKYDHWNSLTANFAAAANLPFLLLQLPQIVLNFRNLQAGSKSALLAVPWLGMLTGLLGNLSLLSYFAKKNESEALVVQALGVVSTFVVISQLAMAEAMPLQHFILTSVAVVSSLIVNALYYFNRININMWSLWEDFITIAGLSALPQVIWSTFVPSVPGSILPGLIAFSLAILVVVMARTDRLPKEVEELLGIASGWSATLLFMWMPISQMLTNFRNPNNIKGLSAFSMVLALIGNGLMIPRALFIRDLMWFTGSSWASVLYGLGNLACMYCSGSISKELFLATIIGFFMWIGVSLWGDARARGYSSLIRPLKELVFRC